MLDSKAPYIEYQAQTVLLKTLVEIYDGKRLGNDRRKYWDKANALRIGLEIAEDKDLYDEDQISDLTHVYECMVIVGELNKFPSSEIATEVVAPVTLVGIQGPEGDDGQSAYLYIGYASDNLGTGFSTTPSAALKYIAILRSTAPIITLNASAFSGLWQKYIGDDGGDGNDGNDGSDGNNGADGSDGNTVLAGAADPTTEGTNGDFYINTSSQTLFGPKASGSWPSGVSLIGSDGADGADGNTIHNGSGAPSSGLGNNGDFYIDTLNYLLYGPKSGGVWGSSASLIGPTGSVGSDGNDGSDGADGSSSYTWIAYADSSTGSGFTLTFDDTKDYIAVLVTTSSTTPASTAFNGLWVRYKGQGDSWATFSISSMTIATGTKSFVVETSLSYTTGQYIVIAEDGNPTNRMEGYVINYDKNTGQINVDVVATNGAGTIANWDVNLQAGAATAPNTGEPFENIDIDIATSPEVVDTFAASVAKGVRWDFVIEQSTIRRVSCIQATWNASSVTYVEYGAVEIGDSSPVTMSVDLDSGNIRLLATVTTDNWIVTGRRYLINT